MIWLGILIGIAISSIWNLVLRLLVKKNPQAAGEIPEPPTVRIGPFIQKKNKQKRKPVSRTDEEIWALENKDKLL